MGKNEHIKMPSVKERCLRKILPVGMAVALAGSAIAGPVAAFAATTHTYDAATITITGSAAGDDETFDAYKIFNADIAVDAVTAQDTASHIEWASSAAQTATLAFLDSLTGAESYSTWLTTKGYTQTGAHDNAQNAAEFIAEMIANDGAATGFASVDGTTASGTESVPVKTAGSFTDRFARAIEGSAMTVSATSTTAGVISGVTEGYFLVVTTPSTIGADEAGSAPMFVPFGGSITTLQAKEAAPGVTFQVKEDKTDTFGGAADSNKDQDLVYKIVGTLPANFAAYSSFADAYAVALPSGLTMANGDTSSVQVKVGGVDVTSQATIGLTSNVLTVSIADLLGMTSASTAAVTVPTFEKQWRNEAGQYFGTIDGVKYRLNTSSAGYYSRNEFEQVNWDEPVYESGIGAYISDHQRFYSASGSMPLDEGSEISNGVSGYLLDGTEVSTAESSSVESAIEINKDSTIEITYKAHTNANMTMGSTGEQTTMTRTYTADPVTLATQAATPRPVTNFAYQTHVTKLDKSAHNPLAGAGFYIQAVTDQGTLGDYVQADGSLGATPYEFFTGDGTNGTTLGEFHVPQLDEGVYTIHENTVPSSYQAPVSDAVLTITSSLDPSTQTITYAASVTGGEQAEVDGDYSTQLTASTPATGLAEVQIVNEKEFAMPYTGLKGNTGLYVAAFALGIGGATAVAVGMRRRREDGQD